MTSFWGELKRRNVVRVAIAYAIVSWLLLQVADVVLDNIEAPTWVFQAILLLLIIGFPVALILAWAFELTPEGLKKEKDVDRSESITQITGRKLDFIIIMVMALAIGYFAYDEFVIEPAPAVAQIIGTETRITTDPANQFAPAISGDLVVYSDDRNGNFDIYLYDLSTDTEVQVTTGSFFEGQGDVDQGLVVYTKVILQNGEFNNEIFLFNVAAGTHTNITNHPALQAGPSIGDGVVAWEDRRDQDDTIFTERTNIYAYLIASETVVPVATSKSHELDPAVSNSRVAYEKIVGDDIHISVIDLSTAPGSFNTTHPGRQQNPAIDGDIVVWQDDRKGNFDIYAFDLSTGVETQITFDQVDQKFPQISGNFIIWEDQRNGDSHIYLYDLSTGTESQITTNPSNQRFPDIDGHRIVYQDDRNAQLDIYVFKINQAPMADAGLDQTVHLGTLFTLDGSGSADPDGDLPLGFLWEMTATPSGSAATLSDPSASMPSFTPDLLGDYTIELAGLITCT